MRSISQAAENLYIGQPNLSRILRELEESAGFPIFERTSKGVRPTERGEKYLQHARSILREMEAMDALGPRHPVANRFRVCLPRSGELFDLTARYLASLDPERSLDASIRECHVRQALEMLASGEAELGIIRFRTEYREYFEEQTRQRELGFRILGKFRYQLVMAGRHPLAAKQTIVRADLAGFPEIVHGDTFRVHNMIQSAIRDYKLTGVVICSCSPRMHETTFRRACEKAGLNPYLVEIANIREQCSWIHKDKAVGTEKAIILGRAAIAKVQLNKPLQAGESPVTKRALVIGGGIAGIQTALDIADAGYPVDIVEKQPTIGGKMTQLDKTFPTLDCAACILTPKMVEAAQNENIHIYSYSEVEAVKGFVGNFRVTIRKKARYVKEDVCTGCGLCTEKCPQKKVPNEFNLGLDNRRAIYIPFAQAVPKVATIDADYCRMYGCVGCGRCLQKCPIHMPSRLCASARPRPRRRSCCRSCCRPF